MSLPLFGGGLWQTFASLLVFALLTRCRSVHNQEKLSWNGHSIKEGEHRLTWKHSWRPFTSSNFWQSSARFARIKSISNFLTSFPVSVESARGPRGILGLIFDGHLPLASQSLIFISHGFWAKCNLSQNYASVNSSCAQCPPRADPGHQNFFCLGWQIPGGGDSWAVKSPAVGMKKEGKCPVPRQHCNIFHWSHSRVVPF